MPQFLYKSIIMIKYFYFLLFSLSLFSQEVSIPTRFSQDGNLYKNLNTKTNQLTESLTEFQENQKCFVIDFLGRDNYKVKFKDWIGIVKNDDLLVNEEMMDLYYDYQDRERDRLIASEAERKKKIQDIVNKESPEVIEKRRQDSLALVEKLRQKELEEQEQAGKLELALKEQKRQDSIVLVKKLKQKAQEVQEQASKLEILRAQKRQDSINKINEERKRKQALDVRAKNLLKEIREKRIQDSLARVSENEKKLSEVQKVDEKIKEEKSKSEDNEYRLKCHYVIDEYDDFYKKVYIRTEPYLLNKNLTVELYKYGRKECVFFNLNEDLGCASYLPSNRSSVKVTLENNYSVTFYHSWDMDCGNFSFKANLLASQILKLKESPIKSVKLKGTKGSTTIIDIEYKEFFMDKLKCIE